MANLVSTSLFVGEMNIVTTNADINVFVDKIIEQNELSLVEKLFGEQYAVSMYTLLQDAGISNVMKIFRDGGVFTYAGNQYKTKGVLTTLTYFLFATVEKNRVTIDSEMGTTQLNSDKDVIFFDKGKIVNAWNQGIKELNKLNYFIQENKALFYTGIEINTNFEEINSFGI